MNKELLYNQSGIKDETAYKAITNIESEGVYVKGYEVNKGEVWEVESGVGTKMVVVLNCYERYAATVMLSEQEPDTNAVGIVARGMMYADAGRLGYVFYDKMVDYVRRLSESEDQELRQAIAYALELPLDEQPYESMAADANREIEGLQYEIAQLRKELAAAKEAAQLYEEAAADAGLDLETERREVEYLRKELKKAEEEAAAAEYTELQPCISAADMVENQFLREELTATRREVEIYKGLYEKILNKVLG